MSHRAQPCGVHTGAWTARRRIAALAVAATLGLSTGACTAEPASQSPQQAPAQQTPEQPTPGPTPPSGLPPVVAEVEPSVVTVLVGEGGLGSGVVFREGGLVLTNEHVVSGTEQVELALASGARTSARVVAADAVTDLAVLRAERTDLPPAEFRTALPAPGELVLAVGSPLGFRNSVTMGIVSGVGREIPGSAQDRQALVDLIQTDAAISPGNSGGALVDRAGRVVGINDAYIPPQTGAVALGFAIPAATAQQVATDLLEDGEVTHPYVGVVPGRVTPEVAAQLGLPSDRGVLVRDVAGDAPAAEAGLRPGDVIVGFNGERVDTLEQFLGALRGVEPGQTVSVTYRRGDDTTESQLTLGAIER